MILNQVNKYFLKRCISNQFIRYYSERSQILFPLENRRILKVKGKDAPMFLQGLITNDMRHFEDGAHSMYAMFLNNKGRVLYDTLIYKWEGGDCFLIECDKHVLSLLQKHLKLYKLRRLVEIEDMSQILKLWTLISPTNDIPDTEIDPKKDVNLYKDPRLTDLGYRVLSPWSLQGMQVAECIGNNVTVEKNEDGYKYLRYKLGVCEGADDLLPASCFPLEVNCDYLHGVSFHKGCYIGQELTARVHHTGVVRKRIMPLKFTEKVNEHLGKDTVITASSNPKSNIGKLKNYIFDYGLGLMRIKEALETSLVIGDLTVEAVKPTWWPIEAPKEKAIVTKD